MRHTAHDQRQLEDMTDQRKMREARMALLQQRVEKYERDGMNIMETARVLGVSSGTVKRMRRGRR